MSSPLMIFPEGTTSNNTHILKFKRGAFNSLRSCVPMTVQYLAPVVHPSNEVIPDMFVLILMLCTIQPTLAITRIYPVFRPTDYLFNTHGKQDKPKWEVYGDAVREVMCEQSGLKPND